MFCISGVTVSIFTNATCMGNMCAAHLCPMSAWFRPVACATSNLAVLSHALVKSCSVFIYLFCRYVRKPVLGYSVLKLCLYCILFVHFANQRQCHCIVWLCAKIDVHRYDTDSVALQTWTHKKGHKHPFQKRLRLFTMSLSLSRSGDENKSQNVFHLPFAKRDKEARNM